MCLEELEVQEEVVKEDEVEVQKVEDVHIPVKEHVVGPSHRWVRDGEGSVGERKDGQ